MGDFALVLDDDGQADLAIADDDLAEEQDLYTAILLSIGTDARAEPGDTLPTESTDRRGWLGDEFSPVEGDRHGSLDWLLERSKRTEDIIPRSNETMRQALAWMVEERIVEAVDVETELVGAARFVSVTVTRQGEPKTYRLGPIGGA